MNAETLSDWVEGLMQECARWNIVFVHLGDAYPEARAAVLPRMESASRAVDFVDETPSPTSLRLIYDLEDLSVAGAPGLGRLRERVHADRDNGTRIVLLSRRPRIAFPNVPGSSLLRDAKLVLPPRYMDETADSSRFGVEALAAGTPSHVVLTQALRELGPAVCASLDTVIFEDGDPALGRIDTLEEPEQDALLSSGLVLSGEGDLSWAMDDAATVIGDALSEVIAGMHDPQDDFAHVSSSCWAIERLIKHAIRSRATALWGGSWKLELLDEKLRDQALLRANGATYAGAGADSVQQLRDPLEWVSLSETLRIRSTTAVGTLGVREEMWTKLRDELLPIKDRVERSQLVRKHDIDVTHRWESVLSKRLSMSGSPSPDEVIAKASLTQREILKRVREDLTANSQFSGDVAKDMMSLVFSTVRFLALTLDSHPPYTAPLTGAGTPVEREIQEAYKSYLDMSDLAGRAAMEVSSIGAGRADVVLYFNDGTRYVTEVKRELSNSDRTALDKNYLPQTVAYQAANVPFGQLLVLDLTARTDPATESLDRSIWVTHSKDEAGAILASTVVAVVRGNRPTPSARK